MSRYAIWDKKSDIITQAVDVETGKACYTAEEYIEMKAPWAASPNVKVVVYSGALNGRVFSELGATIEHYKRLGAEITDDMTDEEILAAIEYFEDNPPEPAPSCEERIAAALEFGNLLSM